MEKDKEYSQLVCIDLSARLPYGVKVQVKDIDDFTFDGELRVVTRNWCRVKVLDVRKKAKIKNLTVPLRYVKAYLRPMGDMTEDECDMVEEILGEKCVFDFMQNGDIVLHKGNFTQDTLAKLYDYFNSIHVDYRGLIEKGFALEAPKGMYDTKKE